MYYGEIKSADIANGLGVRVTLFVSGCRNKCKGCFQPETWNFNYGKEFTEETIEFILKELEPYYISGLTLLGGDPFEVENQKVVLNLAKKVKEVYPNKNIWAYTGYLLDDKDCKYGKLIEKTEFTDKLLNLIDVLVDGPFVEELKDITLKFKGSKNQRVIDMDIYRISGNIEEIEFKNII